VFVLLERFGDGSVVLSPSHSQHEGIEDRSKKYMPARLGHEFCSIFQRHGREYREPEDLKKSKTKRDSRRRISRLKSSDRPCAFGADLLNDRVGREIWQEQRGDEHGAEDGFDAV
jgi:hypothetical protein